jgi:integrase
MSWDSEIVAWMDWARSAGMGEGTIDMRRRYIGNLGKCVAVGPWDVTLDDLAGYLARPDWMPATRRSAQDCLRAFYGWGALTGRIPRDPTVLLPPVRVPARVANPTPRRTISAALERADERTTVMLLLARLAGLRRAEIACLHSDDIIRDTHPYLRVLGKGGKTRLVPIHPELLELLVRLPDGWLFPSRKGGHLKAGTVGQLLSEVLGPGWTGHTLRHRFGVDAYAVRRDILAVKELLGHASLRATLLYTQVPDGEREAAVASLQLESRLAS